MKSAKEWSAILVTGETRLHWRLIEDFIRAIQRDALESASGIPYPCPTRAEEAFAEAIRDLMPVKS